MLPDGDENSVSISFGTVPMVNKVNLCLSVKLSVKQRRKRHNAAPLVIANAVSAPVVQPKTPSKTWSCKRKTPVFSHPKQRKTSRLSIVAASTNKTKQCEGHDSRGENNQRRGVAQTLEPIDY